LGHGHGYIDHIDLSKPVVFQIDHPRVIFLDQAITFVGIMANISMKPEKVQLKFSCSGRISPYLFSIIPVTTVVIKLIQRVWTNIQFFF
jgi:hypothetical protein